jgi:hypothetical protein
MGKRSGCQLPSETERYGDIAPVIATPPSTETFTSLPEHAPWRRMPEIGQITSFSEIIGNLLPQERPGAIPDGVDGCFRNLFDSHLTAAVGSDQPKILSLAHVPVAIAIEAPSLFL